MKFLILTQFKEFAEGAEITLKIGYTEVVGMVITNAQTATYIDILHHYSGCFNLLYQFIHLHAEVAERRKIGNLTADMEMQAFKRNMRHRHTLLDGRHQILYLNAELIDIQSCSDFLMGMRIHVRIDAEAYMRYLVHLSCNTLDILQFLYRFHIEGSNLLLECETNLPIGFCYPRKENLLRFGTCFQRSAHLSSAHTIRTQTGINNRFENGLCRTCFYGIMHMPIGLLRTSFDFLYRLP